MGTFIVIILGAAIALLTLLSMRCRKETDLKKYLKLNLITASAASLVTLLIPFLVYLCVFFGDYSEEWQSWAWDAFLLIVKSTLPLCIVGVAFICLTALVSTVSKSKRNGLLSFLRQVFSAVFSVVLLILACFYSVMAETDLFPVHVFVFLFGLGEALTLRWTCVLELALKTREKKQNKK